MASIFDLKTDTKQIPGLTTEIARMDYEQQPPTRNVTLSNFPNGAIQMRWQTSGQRWWIPNRSYLRLRCQLSAVDPADPAQRPQLKLRDNIAPNMGLCATLFQSAEFRINDKTVSRIAENMPQVDALETRLSKTRSWMNGVGKVTNFWDDDFKSRQCDICVDGSIAKETESVVSRLALGFDAATNTVAVAVDTGVLTFAQNGGAPIPPLATIFQAGDVIEIDAGGAIGTVRYVVSAVDAGALTMQLNNVKTIAIGAAGLVFRRIRKVKFNDEARKVKEFELTWTPPLSIFKIGHAMPSGKYELVLNPQTASVYQKAAIESLGVDKVPGTDFRFEVVDMYMYVSTIEGPRSDDLTYLIDLEQTRCQAEKIDSTSMSQKSWDVSPATYALTVAYQDLRAGTNTQVSASKFKSYNAALDDDTENRLTRFFIQYAGMNLPSPDADPNFTTAIDYTTQRYVESQLYSGVYYDSAGGETIQEFHSRGSYYYFSWPRDGTDRSTRVTVHQQFQPDPPGGAYGGVTNMRVLLFDHSKQVARVRVQDGRVVSVDLQDA